MARDRAFLCQHRHMPLFNLADDIGEKTNLAETISGKADEMSAALIAYLKSVNAETPIRRRGD